MFGTRRAEPAGAIDLSEADLKDALEVIRAFLPGKQEIVGGIYIDPPTTLEPYGFGILLADLLHHGAAAYAYKFGLDVDQARYAISNGLQNELSLQTGEIKSINPELDN